jgi:hypothetical protein
MRMTGFPPADDGLASSMSTTPRLPHDKGPSCAHTTGPASHVRRRLRELDVPLPAAPA